MRKCKPEYEYLKDGHVMCNAEKCPYRMKFMFIHERTQEQMNFRGCVDLINTFYLREIFIRIMGMQQVGEQTRNIAQENSKQTRKAVGAITSIANTFEEMKKIANVKNRLTEGSPQS